MILKKKNDIKENNHAQNEYTLGQVGINDIKESAQARLGEYTPDQAGIAKRSKYSQASISI